MLMITTGQQVHEVATPWEGTQGCVLDQLNDDGNTIRVQIVDSNNGDLRWLIQFKDKIDSFLF